MFGLGPATKVYLALGATDMRKDNANVPGFRLAGTGLDWVAFNVSTLAVSFWT